MVGFRWYRAKGKPLGGQGEVLCTRGTQGRPPSILLAVFPEVYHTLHPFYPKLPTLSRPNATNTGQAFGRLIWVRQERLFLLQSALTYLIAYCLYINAHNMEINKSMLKNKVLRFTL